MLCLDYHLDDCLDLILVINSMVTSNATRALKYTVEAHSGCKPGKYRMLDIPYVLLRWIAPLERVEEGGGGRATSFMRADAGGRGGRAGRRTREDTRGSDGGMENMEFSVIVTGTPHLLT